MSQRITLDLPDTVVQQAQAVAVRTQRSLEDVLTAWIDQFAAELPVEALDDAEVLALASLHMPDDQQDELHLLQALNRESALTAEQQMRLDVLMNAYRRGMVRKAQALKVAVERGLVPPLS